MIAASEPQEFVPCGRQQVKRHPGEVVLPSTQPQLHPESFLLHRLSQVAISDTSKETEWWHICSSSSGEEEELYVKGRTAVWSRGVDGSRVVLCCYTCETPVKHALWCTFHTSASDRPVLDAGNSAAMDEPKGTPMSCICIIDCDNVKVFTNEGEDYISSLQFQVADVWSTKFGIMLERATAVKADSSSECGMQLPTVFALLHPLDEVSPVLAKHGGLSYMSDPSQKIVFTSEEPSICMVYDSKTGLHSVWKIRKAHREECQTVCRFAEGSLNQSSLSLLVVGSSGSNKTHSVFASTTVDGSKSSFTASPQLSRSHSPMAAISRCQSPSVSANNMTRLTLTPSPLGWLPLRHQQVSSWSPGSGTPPPDARLMTSHTLVDNQVETKPVYPELCLEHVWTENLSVPRDVPSGASTKVFLSSDLVGQTYLCYLVQSQLFCTRLEKDNLEQKLIFGVVNSISAKDAAPLPHLNMIATVDQSGGIVLYSGMSTVGKVHVAGIPSALTTSSYLSLNLGSQFTSPFPRRSSLLSTSRPTSAMEPRFDDEVFMLSPVHAHHEGLDGEELGVGGFILSTPRQGQLLALRDPVGSRITLEYSDGSLFRISLPQLCSSPLVSDCLSTLKQVLQRDLAMHVLIKWYGVRNAPGTQDISPAQEWQLFIGVLLELMGYDVDKLTVLQQAESDGSAASNTLCKKQRVSDCGSDSDWDYLLLSGHHYTLGHSLAHQLGLQPVEAVGPPSSPCTVPRINSNAVLFSSLPLILFSLHLLYEELKLNMLVAESLPLLAQVLHQLACDLQLQDFVLHYWKDFPFSCPLVTCSMCESQVTEQDLKKLPLPSFVPATPPSIFQHIYQLIRRQDTEPFPYIRHVNKKTKDVVQLIALLMLGYELPHLQLDNFVRLIVPPGSRAEPQELLSTQDMGNSSKYDMPYRAVLLMAEMGITRRELQTLPASIALLLNDAIYSCRSSPPPDWPESAYRLIVRQDLAAQCCRPKHVTGPGSSTSGTSLCSHLPPSGPVTANGSDANRKTAAAAATRVAECEQDDGMETMDQEILKLRFSKDHRVAEVRHLLQSSQPVQITITQRPEVSDHEFIEEQEKHLYAICTRTMALPVGRGMFTLRTAAPVVTETLPIPRLCLTGRAPPRGTTVDLSHIEVVPNMNLWPLFHNGVAAGLRIAPNASNIDSNWIVFNKPKGTSEVPTEHAGFLMALGLNGHLSNLAEFNTYEYLIKCHEMTSVGLLLGVAATKRGTMDVSTTKLMSIHVEALLPPTSIELDIPQNIQVAALLGVGLIFEGTAHRHIAEVLLSEIGRPPGPEMENSVDRESYSLAAGLALGLVVLGKGSKLCGLGDLAVPDTLHYYMVGGHRRPLTGSQKEKYKSPSYQIREGDSVNIDVTSPGATLALGMMYFNTGNRAVADWMKAPDTQYLLDFVRPDFLLLRIVARSLILWNDILPTSEWVESNLPDTIKPYCLVKPRPGMPDNVDYETMNQAYCNILAGACMALGLRFAGSANNEAFKTLFKYAKTFTSLTGKSIAELAGKSTIETCLSVILLSLAMVMAGTGELEVLRMCRYLRSRVGPTNSVVTYGSHLATHMALGLLFLGSGRYTLGTSPSAVAAMICAFFPKFPTHSNDNRYHLQAFRHLYVLAVEPRLLVPRDIDTGHLCYVHLTVVYLDTPHYKDQQVRLKAPCILPELSKLREVKVEDERYWDILFHRDRNWGQLQILLQNSGCLDVKQRAGCLSYLEDPQGFRSLLAQTLTSDSTISWSIPAESICAFSSDPTMVNFAHYFLETEGCDGSSVELDVMQRLTMLVYECVTQDKLGILPIWITLLKAMTSLQARQPHVFLTWQLKLLAAQVLADKSRTLLVTPGLALSVQQHVTRVLDSWQTELAPALQQYLSANPQRNSTHLRQLVTYLTYCDIPSPAKIAPLLKGDLDLVALSTRLQPLGLPMNTVYRIQQVLGGSCEDMKE
ncbi:anaphase-promoting complex subunit 1 isoform X2 [Periplaneta americana]|uniref:anaphase-promoting complex subunit 1 isoform X2 n=1 Tax=Periplaneta americana TaxID=6978 RepID=UPI0037E9B541